MAEERRTLLEKLEQESKQQQERFMNGIAKRLGRERAAGQPQHPFRGAPDFWRQFELPDDERINLFMENWKSVGGHALRFSGMDEVKAFISEKAAELGAQYIIRQNQPMLNELGLESLLKEAKISVWNSDPEENWKARAAEADIGIVAADYAVAYTGSLTVVSSSEKGRSVSLLPTVLMAIVPVEKLKTRLGEVLIHFDQMKREELPAGVHFISGPSRSADIENDLTIGVHGPGIVYALIVG